MEIKNKRRKIRKTLVTIVIIIVEIGILHFLVNAGAAPPGGVDATLSMLLTCVTYYVISGFFTLFKRYRQSFWTAICAFIFLCIFVCYTRSYRDILAFAVSTGLILHSMMIIKDMMIKAGMYEGELFKKDKE